MTTLSNANPLPGLAAAFGARPRRANRAWRSAAMTIVLVAIALGLRSWNAHATLESSDQAALAYMVQYNHGIQWIFAHDYGPVLPAIEAAWCRLLGRLDLPINERALRIPIIIMSLAQVLLTGPLMRRLGFSRISAGAGCLAVAVLPALVSDAHYLWAYQTTWLLFGCIALWATLAWLDQNRPWQLWLAGAALFVHCLSSLYSYALPLALLILWIWRYTRSRHDRCDAHCPHGMPGATAACADAADARTAARACLLAFILPCVAALSVIVACWLWTGQGQLGRLLTKNENGTAGLHLVQLLQLPRLWCSQLGPVFGAIAAGAVATGLFRLRERNRRSLAALWATASILPFTLLADWDRIGYAPHYTFEAVFAATLLSAAWLAESIRAGTRWKAVAIPLALAAGLQLTLASVDHARPADNLLVLTGIRAPWGEVRPDSGAKAAGYYVRRYVPRDLTVLSLHTRNGMELPVAEYYCGRKVLAHYDLPERVLPELWRRLEPRVDVVIVDPAQAGLLSGSDLRCVCTLRRAGRVVRMLFARPELRLPARDAEISVMNAAYERECVPRAVPLPLSAPPDFLEDLAWYQRTLADLHRTSRLARLSR